MRFNIYGYIKITIWAASMTRFSLSSKCYDIPIVYARRNINCNNFFLPSYSSSMTFWTRSINYSALTMASITSCYTGKASKSSPFFNLNLTSSSAFITGSWTCSRFCSSTMAGCTFFISENINVFFYSKSCFFKS